MTQVFSTADSTGFTLDGSPTVSYEEQTNSFSAEELYLYQTNQINLKKGLIYFKFSVYVQNFS